jgi:hypothetical protein
VEEVGCVSLDALEFDYVDVVIVESVDALNDVVMDNEVEYGHGLNKNTLLWFANHPPFDFDFEHGSILPKKVLFLPLLIN